MKERASYKRNMRAGRGLAVTPLFPSTKVSSLLLHYYHSCSYVDAHRSVAVHLGTSDLKSMMKTTAAGVGKGPGVGTGGPGQQVNPDLGPGDPNDVMYLKQVR